MTQPEVHAEYIDRLAAWLKAHVPPNDRNSWEHPVDTAIRLLSRQYAAAPGHTSAQAIADAITEATANPGREVPVRDVDA